MEPFVGEIKLFAGNFAPLNWAFCDGALLNIADYEPLFNLIGTTYGGNGQTNFALPDLRSRVPVHQGTGRGGERYLPGQPGGVEAVTITEATMPAHNHPLYATTGGQQHSPSPATLLSGTASQQDGTLIYGPATTNITSLIPASITTSQGGGLPHANIQPYQAVNYIIALYGIYPSQG